MRCIKIALLLVLCTTIASADLLVSRGNQGVDRYSDDGAFLGNFIPAGSGGLGDARGIAVAPNRDVLVGDFATDRILRYDYTGAFVGVFSADLAISNPFDVVFGPDGNVYVATSGGNSTIARLDGTTGALVNSSFVSGSPQPIGGPQYIEFGSNNVLYLTDVAGRLFRFNATTGVWISTSFYDNPEGVAFGADDSVYVAQRISDNVLRVPPLGGGFEEVIPTGSFGGGPADLEFGPNGLLYLSADQIYRFDVSGANGVLVDSFGTGGEFITFFTPVPEPATNGLTCLALLVGVAIRRRK